MLIDDDELSKGLALATVELREGEVFELRVLPSGHSGTFRFAKEARAALAKLAGTINGWDGAYFMPNPMMGEPTNALKVGKAGRDADVTRRRWLLLDVDPERPKVAFPGGGEGKASATDREKAHAWELRQRIVADLQTVWAFPLPVMADSGNGYHAMWAVDLPATSDLPERFLATLARNYDCDTARVDKAVKNAARIWKLPGTLACKGPPLPDRPWRMSRIETIPDGLRTVTADTLEAMIEAMAPPPAPVVQHGKASAASDTFSEARERYKRERTPAWPVKVGTCPMCGHGGCFHAMPGVIGKWFCFSSDHQQGGKRTPGGWIGDVIDIDCHVQRCSEKALLVAAGYLPESRPAREPEWASEVIPPGADATDAAWGESSEDAPEPPAWATEEIPGDAGGLSQAMPSHLVSGATQLANMNAAKEPTLHPALLKGPGELGLDLNVKPTDREMLLTRRPEGSENGESVGYLPRGIVAMLVGEGGAGKSQAAIQLAIAVATAGVTPTLRARNDDHWADSPGGKAPDPEGGLWLGTYKATAPGRVLLALAEEDEDEIRRRVWWTVRAMEGREESYRGSSGPRWPYAEAVNRNVRPWALAGATLGFVERVERVKGAFKSDAYEATEAFREFQKQLVGKDEEGNPKEWALIVLDPATRFLGADSETDNKAATEWIARAQELTQLPGNPTVLIVHHSNKAARQNGSKDASASRGSSALTDGARWVALLAEGDVADLQLSLVKANYVRCGAPLDLVRGSGGQLRRMTDEERKEREEARFQARLAKARTEQVEKDELAKALKPPKGDSDKTGGTRGTSGANGAAASVPPPKL
jgi:hypothetical protein